VLGGKNKDKVAKETVVCPEKILCQWLLPPSTNGATFVPGCVLALYKCACLTLVPVLDTTRYYCGAFVSGLGPTRYKWSLRGASGASLPT
jgi:hypothetical protein